MNSGFDGNGIQYWIEYHPRTRLLLRLQISLVDWQFVVYIETRLDDCPTIQLFNSIQSVQFVDEFILEIYPFSLFAGAKLSQNFYFKWAFAQCMINLFVLSSSKSEKRNKNRKFPSPLEINSNGALVEINHWNCWTWKVPQVNPWFLHISYLYIMILYRHSMLLFNSFNVTRKVHFLSK